MVDVDLPHRSLVDPFVLFFVRRDQWSEQSHLVFGGRQGAFVNSRDTLAEFLATKRDRGSGGSDDYGRGGGGGRSIIVVDEHETKEVIENRES